VKWSLGLTPTAICRADILTDLLLSPDWWRLADDQASRPFFLELSDFVLAIVPPLVSSSTQLFTQVGDAWRNERERIERSVREANSAAVYTRLVR